MMHGYDHSGQNLSGWLAQEKMDGCRAFWTGEKLITRSARLIQNVPAGMLAELQALGEKADCELWAGRDLGLEPARLAAQDYSWHPALVLMVFDLPSRASTPAAERLAAVAALPAGQFVKPTSFWTIEHTEHAKLCRRAVHMGGGEGLMVRNPSGKYKDGRRECLLKLK